MKPAMTPRWLKRVLNLWPPFLGAGIKVLNISDDWTSARVRLKLGKLNSNYFGTAYGGSLFSMTDPFFALLLLNKLGRRDYIVWDKESSIKFIAPGKTHVYADFEITPEILEDIRQKAGEQDKYEPTLVVDIYDEHKELVAKVSKKLYIKKKRKEQS
ncbi:DUF4442 domain-containing protein [Pleionea sp. CnH1-48]|uniref:DUF4442 domain-containing protein n=1 Tax=Pleionea sp. CnH1-48 TaxID=2954494 RepID=UPI0020972284|nr:DUF4442 domain-containing protein [Pleionea sp. CnH1-48]MCO7224521.1 DUF4442 domain-containing protein [Pleionea sp. CnH1-48]